MSSDLRSLLVTTSESRACCLPQRQPTPHGDTAARGWPHPHSPQGVVIAPTYTARAPQLPISWLKQLSQRSNEPRGVNDLQS